MKAGQTVKVKFDAIPGTTFEGTVKTVGGMTAGFFFNSDSSHTFDVTIELNRKRSAPASRLDGRDRIRGSAGHPRPLPFRARRCS